MYAYAQRIILAFPTSQQWRPATKEITAPHVQTFMAVGRKHY